MESIFSKDASAARVVTVYDRIGSEIAHLNKGSSVRDAGRTSKAGAWAASIALFLLLGLFFMDPFLYSIHKATAIRAYLYLHSYGAASTTAELVGSGVFSKSEISEMDAQHGSFQSYFTSTTDAKDQAQSTVDFITSMRNLRYGHYQDLDPIGKLRYLLFIRIGLYPPSVWSGLNPSVE